MSSPSQPRSKNKSPKQKGAKRKDDNARVTSNAHDKGYESIDMLIASNNTQWVVDYGCSFPT